MARPQAPGPGGGRAIPRGCAQDRGAQAPRKFVVQRLGVVARHPPGDRRSLGVMFWPYMIPYTITVANAAAPDASLAFLFKGAVFILPVIVVVHRDRVLGVPRQGAQGLRLTWDRRPRKRRGVPLCGTSRSGTEKLRLRAYRCGK